VSCYLVKFIDEDISISEYQNQKFIPLKNKGEESWRYDPSFWEWFKSKIEYNGENLSFIVLSDSDFEVASSINISSNHHLGSKDIMRLSQEHKQEGLELLTFPKVEIEATIPKAKTTQPTKSTLQPKKGSLQEYFISQTQKYKGKV
jgi:hypothetical protein